VLLVLQTGSRAGLFRTGGDGAAAAARIGDGAPATRGKDFRAAQNQELKGSDDLIRI
jgi:hypothetical protein